MDHLENVLFKLRLNQNKYSNKNSDSKRRNIKSFYPEAIEPNLANLAKNESMKNT